jgi:endothelin-converting enzyme
VEFEKQLAAASPDAEDRDDVTVNPCLSSSLVSSINQDIQKYYNPMSLDDADKITPEIHLAGLVKSLEPSDIKTQRVIVMSPTYMANLSEIISSTSKDTLQTYLVWKTIQAFASYVEADELKPYKRFLNELQGKV